MPEVVRDKDLMPRGTETGAVAGSKVAGKRWQVCAVCVCSSYCQRDGASPPPLKYQWRSRACQEGTMKDMKKEIIH